MDGDPAKRDVSATKRTLRDELRAVLAARDLGAMARWSGEICGHVVDHRAFGEARTVLMYVPIVGEPDLRPVARACAEAGKRVCLPRVAWEDRSLWPAVVESLDEGLVESRHGIMEPHPDAELVEPERIDLILVPGLGFDPQGGRLGRGAGFYDRFLSQPGRRSLAWGVGFGCQMIDRVPREPHDAVLDAIVTEDGLFEGGARRG